jgi:hypothetical protein
MATAQPAPSAAPARRDQPPPVKSQYVPPPDAAWMLDAELDISARLTDMGLGAAQGVIVRDGRIYGYGDLVRDAPRVGIIREYDGNLKATGRAVRLTRRQQPLIVHRTGLTWDDRFGTFLGDTVGGMVWPRSKPEKQQIISSWLIINTVNKSIMLFDMNSNS